MLKVSLNMIQLPVRKGMQGYPKFFVGQFTLLINNILFYSRLLQMKTKKTKLLKIYQKSADPVQTIKTEPEVFQSPRQGLTVTTLGYCATNNF